MTLVSPPPLAPGDLVAIVAPSSPLPRDELWRGLAWLRTRYRLDIHPGLLARAGYLAGDDARRRAELARAMVDDEVRAIVVARGGYGAMRIVDDLPWERFAQRPKWIAGFSDATAIHAMAWRAGVQSVHAPNATGLGPGVSVATRHAWLTALERPAGERRWGGLRVVRAGRASGVVVGGNLVLVHAMAAAGRLVVPRGAILALEDVGEAPYRIDRMLTSLRLAGYLAAASAVVFGGFERCPPGPDGTTVDDVIGACARSLDVPVLSGAPFGHHPENEAFVLGREAHVDGDVVAWPGPQPSGG